MLVIADTTCRVIHERWLLAIMSVTKKSVRNLIIYEIDTVLLKNKK